MKFFCMGPMTICKSHSNAQTQISNCYISLAITPATGLTWFITLDAFMNPQ